jgi:RimJ/RimL family protein N-acetyltransferase
MTESTRLPTLVTPRLRLRLPKHEDIDDLQAIFSDQEVMRYWSSPPLRGRPEAERLLDEIHANAEAGHGHQWGIERTDRPGIIGTCTLWRSYPVQPRAEVGFVLARAAWGRGYMHEALTALIHHAFGTLQLHRLEADVDPRNERSVRLLERLGFVREGVLRERWLVAGEVQDAVFYGLLAREWTESTRDG